VTTGFDQERQLFAAELELSRTYFTYAVTRWAEASGGRSVAPELRRLARFAVWPAMGLASWAACHCCGSHRPYTAGR
jgi:hypothetical protein